MRFGIAIATSGRSEMLTAILPQVRSILRPQDRLVVAGAEEGDWPAALARKGFDFRLGRGLIGPKRVERL